MGRPSLQAERQAEILEHFYALIREEGLEGASTPKLAKRMGMHSSLLVHYFPNKAAMLEALIDHMLARYEAHFLPRLAGHQGAARLEIVINTLFSVEWDTLNEGQVFYTLYPLIFRFPPIRKRYQQMYARFQHHLTHEIALAQAEGVIQFPDTDRAVDLIITLVEGFNFYEHIRHEPAAFVRQGKYLAETVMQVLRG